MKFSQESLDQGYVITAYEAGSIKVRETDYETALLLMPEKLIGPWSVADINALTTDKVAELVTHDPEIVIIGTGEKQVFPDPQLFMPLMQSGIGYEVMSTGAACRTYNILLAEDRQVLAALIP